MLLNIYQFQLTKHSTTFNEYKINYIHSNETILVKLNILFVV